MPATYQSGVAIERASERKSDGRTYAGALITVSKAHHEVHEGCHYTITAAATKNAGEFLDISFVTPATKRMHYVSEWAGSGQVTQTLLENPTVAATSKVALVEFNNDRESTNVATMVTATVSDTDVSAGTTLHKQVTGGGAAGKDGSAGGGRTEWILKQSEDYVVRLESNAAVNLMAFDAFWYEESS